MLTSQRPPLLGRILDRPWPLWLVLLIPAISAGLLYLPMLGGGLIADDLIVAHCLIYPDVEVGVNWAEIGRNFSGPWLGAGSINYYRPLLSLSLGIDGVLGGGSLAMLHATNIALHCGVVVLCAWICALCSPRAPRLAALIGGGLLALHPAATETVAVIACRNTTLEVLFRLGATVALIHYFVNPARRYLVGIVVCASLAFLAKENAILLLVYFVVLDLMVGPAKPLRQRIKPHLALGGVVACYFLLRLCLFGRLGTSMSGALIDQLLRLEVGPLPQKLGQILAPSVAGGVEMMTVVSPLFFVGVLAIGCRCRAGARVVLLGLGWMLLQLVPTLPLGRGLGMIDSRYVYGSIVSFAVLISMLLAHPTLVTERVKPWTYAASLVTILGLAIGSWNWSGHYTRSWQDSTRLQATIDELGSAASEERPLAFLSLPAASFPPLMSRQLVFAYCERPRAKADYPSINLTALLAQFARFSQAGDMGGDGSAIRAVCAAGGSVLWAVSRAVSPNEFHSWALPNETSDLRLIKSGASGDRRRWLFAESTTPLCVEALRLHLAASNSKTSRVRGELTWVDSGGADAGSRTFDLPVVDGNAAIDLSHDMAFIALRIRNRRNLAGFKVTLEGAELERLEAIPRLPEIALRRHLAGESIAFANIGTRLEAPAMSPSGASMRIVFLWAGECMTQEVKPGVGVDLESEIESDMSEWQAICRMNIVYYYFEEQPKADSGQLARRSTLDYLRLR